MLAYIAHARRALAAAVLLLATACTTESATGVDTGGGTSGTGGGTTPPPGNTSGAKPPEVILGSWVYGGLSMTDYYNASTGAYIGNGYGTSVLFKFTGDGKYEQTIYIQSTVYSCRTDLFIYNEGTVKFSGAEFRVYPTKGRIRSSDTCNAQFNYDRADDIARKQGDLYSWAFEQNANDGKTYLMIGVNGDMTNRSSFRRAQ